MTDDFIHKVDKLIGVIGSTPDKVIPILQAIQKEFNYLPEEALKRVYKTTAITPSAIHGIATFYSQFRLKPVGKHRIKVCVGTACHVKGSMLVYEAFQRALHLEKNEDTDTSMLFTLEKVACLGCCTLAPVVQIDDVTYGHVGTEQVDEIMHDFLSRKTSSVVTKSALSLKPERLQGEIRIGLGSCCIASGSQAVKTALEEALEQNNIQVNVKQVGCVGICNQVPILEIHKEGETTAVYAKIKPEEVREVIKHHFKPVHLVDRAKAGIYNFFDTIVNAEVPKSLTYYNPEKKDTVFSQFLSSQLSIATEYRGEVKPGDIKEYRSKGGFKALEKCLHEMNPAEVIDIINNSGLRGRGGAGFPTALKWKLVNHAHSDIKYMICNGDEGDPGAFMDRMLLESYPYRVIEGMMIAAYASGAREGIFYIRAEYQLAVKRIREAITYCKRDGLLGKGILKSSFDFAISIFEGAGAFVCGEETALIASIEGKRGLPSMRPPYPAEKGLWGKPTLINNVETLSLVPWIIRHGGEAFQKIGTDNSKGTKVFALAGKIKRGGLIEVPMGITIRQIVEGIGGGVPDGRKFKAIQIGGPSGGCIPASMADIPIDYTSLKEAGAMMGSGGLIVLDDTDCMVDIARYFLSFTQNQSCGRCTFCRIGTTRMLQILDKICSGKGTETDIELLEELGHSTKTGSMCGLGKSAPNPILTTIRYFREEYLAHIHGHCPTGKCKGLITYTITEDCIGCTKCAQRCPSQAIEARPYEVHIVDNEKCIKCDICREVCPVNAVITR
jgi:NADH:ubiquinone oxidoreductase subunit F (NADH-binding)/NADH:ubiquinone oxidoreductase subunit E/Pyruvate/2-oxoacid:ferredoxin oxidoreductase delta subunit